MVSIVKVRGHCCYGGASPRPSLGDPWKIESDSKEKQPQNGTSRRIRTFMFVKISPLTILLREPFAAVGARDKEAVRRREERTRLRVALLCSAS